MPRLPIPGSDDNVWGNILNEFLAVEHNADGTQKTVDVSKGGTGATSHTSGNYLVGSGTSAISSKTPAQVKTDLALTKSDVGLNNVDNTSDTTKNSASATLQNKTIDNSNNITVTDSNFTLQDGGDNTKQAIFELSGISTGTTRTYTFPNGSGSLVNLATTQTLSNKRITPRVLSIVSSATPTINTDLYDAVTITAQAEAITSFTTNLTGTPVNFDKLIIRIKDDGTARTITWGTSFESKGVTLPTTTVISKVLTVGFIYDSLTAKWGCVASAQEV